MTTPHVIASSSGGHHSSSATSNGIVGSNFRVGKKIGEGSFGVVFEGMRAVHIFAFVVFAVAAVGRRDERWLVGDSHHMLGDGSSLGEGIVSKDQIVFRGWS